jgi:UDP-N-acetylglucosamine--N-acetylmuramyl-(pentapeptide) pyrophosphoryl-undecaprenol N-acetylglucosamine transferase
MRILFCPSGMGLGHVGRCIPIARRLQKDGVEVLFSTYREGVRYVQHEGFPVVEAPSIGVAVKPDGTIDFRQTTVKPGPFIAIFTFWQQVDAETKFMKAFEPDVIVSDSRASSLMAAKLLGIPKICILNQFQVIIPRHTRFLRLARLADAFTLTVVGKIWTSVLQALIPDFPPPYTISTRNLTIPKAYQKKLKFIGPILPVRPDDLPDRKVIRRKLGLAENKPLIFAPISGPEKERTYFTGILRQIFSKFPDDYRIVMSLGSPEASAEPVKEGNLIVHGWVPNRFEYLKACDIVVSRVGHGTVTHSVCYGKPQILVPTPSHTEQLNNAKKALELGVAEIMQQEDLNKDVLLAAVTKILGNSNFQERAEQIRKKVIKWDGMEAAAKIIVDAAQKQDKSWNPPQLEGVC